MDDELAATIGRNLRQARAAAGLTQQDVAERASLSTEFYARMERGRTLPSVPTLVALADQLGTSLDRLVGSSAAAKPTKATDNLESGLADSRTAEERRLLRKLRKARPATLRLLRLVLAAIERGR